MTLLADDLPPRPEPRLHYWLRGASHQNFGDYLAQFFLNTLLEYPKIEADVFQFVGSVMDMPSIERDLRRVNGAFEGYAAYWCCGARSAEPLPARFFDHALVFGVRGPLSRAALGLSDATVMGDPGFLLPLLHKARRDARTRGRTICIPHILDARGEAELLAASGADLLVSPSIRGDDAHLRLLLDEIASADFVLTASLHGAVVAIAYGVPFAFWDNGHLDVPFKWNDLAASIGIDAHFARDVAGGRRDHAERFLPHYRPLKLAPLLAVCPFTINPAVMLRAMVADGLVTTEAAQAVDAAYVQVASVGPLAPTEQHRHSASERVGQRSLSRLVRRRAHLLYRRTRSSVGRIVHRRR